MYNHTLLLGCTGMLKAATVELAHRSKLMTSVARTRQSLAAVDAVLPSNAAQHYSLVANWSEPETYLKHIEDHIRRTAPPDLVVAWIHDDHLALRLAARLGVGGAACAFFHVIGSAAANPASVAEMLRCTSPIPDSIAYHQVILGAYRDGAVSRWLTHAEISQGVLDAIDHQRPRSIVGTV